MTLSGHRSGRGDTALSVQNHSSRETAGARSADVAEETSAVFTVSRDLISAGGAFEMHSHQEDQIAWVSAGSVELDVQGETWTLRSAHVMWIPAGTMHGMRFPEPSEIVSLYLDPTLRVAEGWDAPLALRADPLARALLLHLSEGTPTPGRRAQCRRLLSDILAESEVMRDVVALPDEPRARRVAARLLDDPADERDIDAWAAEIGVSAKTLARAFVRGTGSTFREWRVNARLQSAARLLVTGVSVQDAAATVGYASTSAFIASFRRRFGTTPATYASAHLAAVHG